MSARCSSCSAPIIWTTTPSGRKMPVDAEPNADGNVWVAGDFTAYVLSRAEIERRFTPEERAAELRFAHFVKCPNAAQHRRAK